MLSDGWEGDFSSGGVGSEVDEEPALGLVPPDENIIGRVHVVLCVPAAIEDGLVPWISIN